MGEGERQRDTSRHGPQVSPILLIVVTIFIDITGYSIVIPLLSFYAAYFKAGSTALGLLLASSSLVAFFFAPILGEVSDKIGRKPILLLSILFSTASFILFAVAKSFLTLLLSRIVSGVASETAVAQAYIADITGDKERTKGIGRIGAAYGAGFIVGPAISGLLSIYGFPVAGFASAVLAFSNFLFVLFFLPEPEHRTHLASLKAPVFSSNYLQVLKRAFLKPLIGVTLVVYLVANTAFATIPVILPLLAIAYFNFNLTQMAYAFIYLGVIQVVLEGVIIGRLTTKLGEERLIVLGPVLMMLGMLLMPLFPNVTLFMASTAMIAVGSGVIQTVIPSFVSKRSAKNEQGEMLGISLSVYNIAFVPGPLIGGLIFELGGPAAPFYVSAGMLAIAFVLGYKVFHDCLTS